MIRAWRLAALGLVGTMLVSCAGPSASFNGSPAELYAAFPSISSVRNVLGDLAWWVGPPTFEVPPLDSATTPATEKYSVSQNYVHIGTAELLEVRYTVYVSTSAASTEMTNLQNRYGVLPATPKVGDEVFYLGFGGNSPATPFQTLTIVRVGAIITYIGWARKDSMPSAGQLGRVATVFVGGLKSIGKSHATLHPVSSKLLPPPGYVLTFLGATVLSLQTYIVMGGYSNVGGVFTLLAQAQIKDFTYGDFALNYDTHMEVQTAALIFPNDADASLWASNMGLGQPDTHGIASKYIPGAGSPAAGFYLYAFSAGIYAVQMVCKASLPGEAASRECEDPMEQTAIAWALTLGQAGGSSS